MMRRRIDMFVIVHKDIFRTKTNTKTKTKTMFRKHEHKKRRREESDWNVCYCAQRCNHRIVLVIVGQTKSWRKTEFLPKVVENRGFDEHIISSYQLSFQKI